MELPELMGLSIQVLLGVSMLFWAWMMVDCVTKEPEHGNNRIIWLIILLLGGPISAAFYYCVRIPRRECEQGEEAEQMRHGMRPI